ncbi:protein of unknown function [Citrobacter amalonaticus]|uniref:Uncharacterized protein n=1 Tax=Citrobacter amalonaticus TaxID=35703 RepID=A0AAX2BNN6_CITAM|nr:protein of unknown function [Citrobacter amalonaticus]
MNHGALYLIDICNQDVNYVVMESVKQLMLYAVMLGMRRLMAILVLMKKQGVA